METHILVVEDSKTQSMLLAKILADAGFRVVEAADAAEALLHLDGERPAIVITDITMPGMDGFELCRTIRARPGLEDLPVLLLTSLADEKEVLAGLEAGADAFITKPYDAVRLVERVVELIGISTRPVDGKGGEGEEPAGSLLVSGGKEYRIGASRSRILHYLVSTYDSALALNLRLAESEAELVGLNAILEEKVAARTATLLASEERYRRFFDDDLAGALTVSTDGRIGSCNPAFARIFGFADPARAIGSSAKALHGEKGEWETFLGLVARDGHIAAREAEYRRPDSDTGSEPIHVIESAVGDFDAGGNLVTVRHYLVDITEKKKLEGQLLEAQKLEAIGRLAGGIAHDFNNILQVILGFAGHLIAKTPAEDPRTKGLVQIRLAADKAAVLVQSLMAFSRKQVRHAVRLDLNALVRDIAPMVRELVGEGVELRLELAEGLGWIEADRSQIDQVLMNLAANARDAMKGKGSLVYLTSLIEIVTAPGQGMVTTVPQVVLSVSDSGEGMTAETMEHMFEPFFTTKGLGKGTGLGLATVYGVIKQAGGTISCQSALGQGTEFRILLPRVAETTA
jgi:PAS domain S-box-containing protein